jgi:hypothetical protein
MRRAAIAVFGLNAIFAWVFFALHFGLARAYDKAPVEAYYLPLIVLGSTAMLSAWLACRGHTGKAALSYYFPYVVTIAWMAFYDATVSTDGGTDSPGILFFLHPGTFFIGLFCGPFAGAVYGIVTVGVFVWAGIVYNSWGDLALNALLALLAVGGAWGTLRLCWRLWYLERRVSALEGVNGELKVENGELESGLNCVSELLGAWRESNDTDRGDDARTKSNN